jgi:hypothetical protein
LNLLGAAKNSTQSADSSRVNGCLTGKGWKEHSVKLEDIINRAIAGLGKVLLYFGFLWVPEAVVLGELKIRLVNRRHGIAVYI